MSTGQTSNSYARFLGLPKSLRQPNHYEILGIDRLPKDPLVIKQAAASQTDKLRKWQNNDELYSQIRQLEWEVAQAMLTLADEEKRRNYDETLSEPIRVAEILDEPPISAEESFENVPEEVDEFRPRRSIPKRNRSRPRVPPARRNGTKVRKKRKTTAPNLQWVWIAGGGGVAVVLLLIGAGLFWPDPAPAPNSLSTPVSNSDPVQPDQVLTTMDQENTNSPVDQNTPKPIRPINESARRAQDRNNLKQIAIAMHNYHDTHQSFPPAKGRPSGLSWRVHLLPYLDQVTLYRQFRLDEPWNSPHNLRLLNQMPDVYRRPGSNLPPRETNYLGIAGPGGIMENGEGKSLRDVRDGTSNTGMVVEVEDHAAVVWTKPEEFVINPQDPLGNLGGWSGGFYVAFCDGSIRFVASDIDPQTLLDILQRNDGHPVRF